MRRSPSSTMAISASARSKSGSLIVTYRGKDLPAKAVLRLAYCLANNIPPDTNLKFASGEGSIKLLRLLGFQAQKLQPDHVYRRKTRSIFSKS